LGDLDNVQGVVEWFKEELARQRELTGRVDRLTFIEKDSGGPVGALTLKDLLSLETKVPSAVVRLGRKGPALKIKMVHPHVVSSSPGDFKTIEPKFRVNGDPERVVVVSDVATTGTTILDTAKRIEEAGGQVDAAFVLYDREEIPGTQDGLTAEQKLKNHKIRLVAMLRAGEMANKETVSTLRKGKEKVSP
jgi:orotate phosphoribosyltransferase